MKRRNTMAALAALLLAGGLTTQAMAEDSDSASASSTQEVASDSTEGTDRGGESTEGTDRGGTPGSLIGLIFGGQ